MHETGDKTSETVRWGMLGAGWRKATPDEGYLLALERITSATAARHARTATPAAAGGTAESSLTRDADSPAPPDGRAVRSRASEKPSDSAGPSSTVSTAKK